MTQRSDFFPAKNYLTNFPKSPLTENHFKELRATISPKMRGKNDSHTPSSKLPPMYYPEIHNIQKSTPKKTISIDSPTKSFDNRLALQKTIDESEKNVQNNSKGKQGLKIETRNDPKNFSNFLLKDLQVNSVNGIQQTSFNLHNNTTTKLATGINNSLTIGSQSTKANYRIRGMSPKKIINIKHPGQKTTDKALSQDYGNLKLDKPEISPATITQLNNNTNKSRNIPLGTLQPSQPQTDIPPFEPTKCSNRKNGVVKAYAANTNQGIVRNYNEDRVAIILNIMKPPNTDYKDEWPICSFFGVYDGHGGTTCADFLRDNLHQFVIRDKNFPTNPKEALRRGFEAAEKQFGELAQKNPNDLDRSGSCAIVTLIVDDTLYVANVGDSRAVMSCEGGKKVVALSRDHKPMDEDEQARIIKAGGKIYQSQLQQNIRPAFGGIGMQGINHMIVGPYRVLPGRLSVSRTFGDMEAKLPSYGGNPNVIIAEPEIKVLKLTKDCDFIILACDGIFDKMTNQDVIKCAWESTAIKAADINQQGAIVVETLMRESLIRRTLDNVTVVMVCLSGFKRALFPKPNKTTNLSEPTEKSNGHTGIEPLAESQINGIKRPSSQSSSKLKKIIDPGVDAEKTSDIKASGISNSKKPSRQEGRKTNLSVSGRDSSVFGDFSTNKTTNSNNNNSNNNSDIIARINSKSLNK